MLSTAGNRERARSGFRLAAETSPDDAGLQIDVLLGLAELDVAEGLLDDAQRRGEHALEAASRTKDASRQLEALWVLKHNCYLRGDWSGALATLERIEALSKETANRPGLASVMASRSWHLSRLGRYAEARDAAKQALELAEQNGNPVAKGWALNALSSAVKGFGDISESLRLLNESLEKSWTRPGRASTRRR